MMAQFSATTSQEFSKNILEKSLITWICWIYLTRWDHLFMHVKAEPVSVIFNVRKILILFTCVQVEFQTASGKMTDLITTLVGEKDLSKFSQPL